MAGGGFRTRFPLDAGMPMSAESTCLEPLMTEVAVTLAAAGEGSLVVLACEIGLIFAAPRQSSGL